MTLYSVATASGTINITPITTLMALNMASGNIQTFLTGSAGTLPALTAADLTDQNTNMDTLLSSNLTAQGLSATYNFSSTAFTTGSAGYDQLLDNVSINSANPAAVTVTNVTAPAAPITIDTADGSPTGALDIISGPTTLPSQPSVPNVVGDTQAAAATAITTAGLTVGTVTQASSTTVASGDVVTESPASGTSVAGGSAVALTISSGPPTYTVGGIVIGLGTSATVHVLNGADSVAVTANGSFTLPAGIISGGAYSVTVGTPTSAQSCAAQNAAGTIASANVTNVVVYCTYKVSVATLNNTYTVVGADFDSPSNGTTLTFDALVAAIYNGAGSINTTSTVDIGGTIYTGVAGSGTYAVTTTTAIPTFTNSTGASGGIEGVNGAAAVSAGTMSGTPSSIGVAVLPNASATTDSINGNYTRVGLYGQVSTGDIAAEEGPVTLTNGSATGTYTSNTSGTITSGTAKGAFTVSNGLVTATDGSGGGAVSADGNFMVVAQINSSDDPNIEVFVHQGTGVTPSTFEGIYSVAQYGGGSLTATFGKVITLYAYGNGTYLTIFTKNANGTITNDDESGTYTVAADGTLTLIDTDGNVYNGALSADGNALVLANISSQQTPAIWAGVRQ